MFVSIEEMRAVTRKEEARRIVEDIENLTKGINEAITKAANEGYFHVMFDYYLFDKLPHRVALSKVIEELKKAGYRVRTDIGSTLFIEWGV